MAGRPRKNTMFTDITDISSTEKKEEVKPIETPKEDVEIAPKPSIRYGVVKSDSWLNIRNSADINSSIVGTLKNGEKITIYEEKDGFGKISETADMWVKLDFITF